MQYFQVRVHLCIHGACCQTNKFKKVKDNGYAGSLNLKLCLQFEYNPKEVSEGDVTMHLEHSGSEGWDGRLIYFRFHSGYIYNDDSMMYHNGMFPLVVKLSTYLETA